MENKRTARVLIRRETASDGQAWYVAQVLEFDLATQAKTIDALTYEIQRMFAAHIVCCEQENVDPFAIPAAPSDYVKEYIASNHTLTVDITRFKLDQPLKDDLPDLSFRFAPGV